MMTKVLPGGLLPDGAIDAFRANAETIFGGVSASTSSITDLSEYTPHSIHAVSADECLAGKAVRGAKQVGWRLLVARDDGAVVSVEFGRNPHDCVEFHMVNEGPFVEGTRRAVATASAAVEAAHAEHGDFEQRFLKIPELDVFAVWLHNREKVIPDVVIPLAPAPISLLEAGPLKGSDFESILQGVAREKAQQHQGGIQLPDLG